MCPPHRPPVGGPRRALCISQGRAWGAIAVLTFGDAAAEVSNLPRASYREMPTIIISAIWATTDLMCIYRGWRFAEFGSWWQSAPVLLRMCFCFWCLCSQHLHILAGPWQGCSLLQVDPTAAPHPGHAWLCHPLNLGQPVLVFDCFFLWLKDALCV